MPRRRLAITLVLAAFAILLHGRAEAGPPYETDDPETPPLRTWEINVAFVLHEERDPSTFDAPSFDFNYGLSRTIQLGFGAPIVHVDPREGTGPTGIGDAAVSVKWRFLEEGDGRPQAAIHPEVSFPTGSVDAGLGEGEYTWLLPLSIQKSWGAWTNFDHAGWVIQSGADTRNYPIFGAALTRQVTRTAALGVEFFGNGATEPEGPSDLGWHVGLTWEISDRVAFIGTGGHGLKAGATATMFAGVQLQLGTPPGP